jgi:hypothetical protein
MNMIERIIPRSRAALVVERLEILAKLTAANSAYHERELPEAQRCLDAAKLNAMWPRNIFGSPGLSAANIALLKLVDAHEELNARCGRELEKIEAELRSATETAVSTFLSEMLDDLDVTRKKFQVISEAATRNPITGKIKQRSTTNAKEINARCQAIFKAREVADTELRFVDDPARLHAEFARLRAELPHVPQPKLDDDAAA